MSTRAWMLGISSLVFLVIGSVVLTVLDRRRGRTNKSRGSSGEAVEEDRTGGEAVAIVALYLLGLVGSVGTFVYAVVWSDDILGAIGSLHGLISVFIVPPLGG